MNSKAVYIRPGAEELARLNAELERSTFQYRAELLRAKVLEKTVTIKFRTEAAEEALRTALDIKQNTLLLLESSPLPGSERISGQISSIIRAMDDIYAKLVKNPNSAI